VRKRTVKNGMCLILAALLLIIIASFYHIQLSDLFLLTPDAESRIYRLGMFWAAAIGGYGVVVTVFGFVQTPLKSDAQVRLLPVFLAVSALIVFFFYLLSSALDAPVRDQQRRLRPGETITI
jgi:nitrate/nitrite transporter NarK